MESLTMTDVATWREVALPSRQGDDVRVIFA
jgi:hypothetical protein